MKKEIKNIYIAGAVTSDINEHGYLHCYQKFENAEKTVAKYFPDAIIYNPMKLCKADWSWIRCMVVCLWVLLKKCDAVVLLDDYKTSKGAMIELESAIRSDKVILRLGELIAIIKTAQIVASCIENAVCCLNDFMKIMAKMNIKQDEKNI